ncbi:MAG: hypothetical protein ABIQ99_05915 [Thermoflexales bacterium]
MNDKQRSDVLEMIDRGELTAAEGLRILEAMQREIAGPGAQAAPAAEPLADPAAIAPEASAVNEADILPPSAPPPKLPHSFRYAWVALTAAGAALALIFSAVFIGLWMTGWFGAFLSVLCLSPLTLLGVLIAVIGLISARAPWAHVRIDTGAERWPRRINVSVPLPLRPVGWLIRKFGRFIPALQRTAVDDVLSALGQADFKREPFIVDVHEGENGERVQIVVG